jgi:hypothetical protein
MTDKIAELERQMRELQEQLLGERALRDAEKKAAENVVRKLSTQLSMQLTPTRASPGTGSGRPTSPRSGGGSNTFFTPVSSARKSVRTQSPGTTPRGPAAAAVARVKGPSAGEAVHAARSGPPEAMTALQYAWKKFCALAEADFTPHELSLVSVSTLGQLLDRYRVRDDVERAQVEAQWSLLQQHQTDVGPEATLYVPQPKRQHLVSPPRSPRTAAAAKETERELLERKEREFDLRPGLAQPHLSNRISLEGCGVRPSNPNDVQSKSPLYQPLRRTPPRTHSPAVSSNPNATVSQSCDRKLCFQRAAAPDDGLSAPSHGTGKARCERPPSREPPASGIRSFGNTHQSAFTAPARGVRVNIGPREGQFGSLDDFRPASPASGGVRTFSARFGTSEAPRPNLVVQSPKFAQQSSLTTSFLANGAKRPPSPTMSSRQLRTPFAVDS